MTSLTDRYVHATLGSVPEEKRDDLGEELRSTITDMVDARIDSGEHADEAEKGALTELGDPGLLAARYTGARLQLIGPRWFLTWKRLVTTLLAFVPAIVATLAAVVAAFDGDATVGEVVVEGLFAGAGTALQIVFWTTLVFAILDRVATEGPGPWSPDSLPDTPVERDYPLGDVVTGIAWNVVIAAALVLQQFRSWAVGPDGDDVAVLDPDLWSFWLPYLLVVLAALIALEVWKYRTGWSPAVVVATAVTSIAFSAPLAWLAIEDRLLNPAFVEAVGLGADGLDLLNRAIAVGAIVIALWEIGEAVLKGFRRRRAPSLGGTLGR